MEVKEILIFLWSTYYNSSSEHQNYNYSSLSTELYNGGHES